MFGAALNVKVHIGTGRSQVAKRSKSMKPLWCDKCLRRVNMFDGRLPLGWLEIHGDKGPKRWFCPTCAGGYNKEAIDGTTTSSPGR